MYTEASKHRGIVSRKGAQEERRNMKSIDSFAIPSRARFDGNGYCRGSALSDNTGGGTRSKFSTTDRCEFDIYVSLCLCIKLGGNTCENCENRGTST